MDGSLIVGMNITIQRLDMHISRNWKQRRPRRQSKRGNILRVKFL